MIPPNTGEPKHLTYHDPKVEEKLRTQLVYQALISREEMATSKFFMGNRLVIKFREEVIGEGQIMLVEEMTLDEVTQYDAVIGGYDQLDELLSDLTSRLPKKKKPEDVELFKILYRWL